MGKKQTWKKRHEDVTSIEQAHLKNLNASSRDEIAEWEKKGREDSYWLAGVKEFCKTVWENRNNMIFIIGDYDADGITATAILYLALTWLGFNVKYLIPHRFTQGYGMNRSIIDKVGEKPSLIITVDNGIAAADAVAYAKSKGHTVIVTDHHEPVKTAEEIRLPNADLIIDPKIMPGLADFTGYCGAGIAYKLARALLKDARGMHILLIPLAAIGTICDQMPIREENFYIVKTALYILNNYNGQKAGKDYVLPGIKALGKALGISTWKIDSIAYQAGPAINSAERMKDGKASDVVKMLTENSLYAASVIADELTELNGERKSLVADAVQEALQDIECDAYGRPLYPIVKYIPSASEGIIGIIAAKIMEEYNLPAAVFTDSYADAGILKGSFRTVDGFSIIDLLRKCGDVFAGYGGHSGAAGASVKKEGFSNMVKTLHEKAAEIGVPDPVKYYDCEIREKDIAEAIEKNEQFAPLDLIFKVTDFVPEMKFGEWEKKLRGNGVKLWSKNAEAVGFNLHDVPEIDSPSPLTIYGKIGMNVFNGRSTPQVTMIDIE